MLAAAEGGFDAPCLYAYVQERQRAEGELEDVTAVLGDLAAKVRCPIATRTALPSLPPAS